jgi:hypothetical protein
MDAFAAIWTNDYPEGKVHKSVVGYLKYQITANTKLERIYRLVLQWGVTDDMDALATYRALRDIRSAMQTYRRKPRISA